MSEPILYAAPSRTAASQLPAEILAYIIELAILTSTPSPRRAPALTTNPAHAGSPFTTPLRAAYASAASWTAQLLYVSRLFYSIARPVLLRTLTLDTRRAARSFLEMVERQGEQDTWGKVERAWLGDMAVFRERGQRIDPVGLRLGEAAWYEECSGGFVVGHAYASRAKAKRRKGEGKGRERERRYRSVSVYWAEEQLVEEVSDPDRSSSDDESDSGAEGQDGAVNGFATSLPSHASTGLSYSTTQHDTGEPSRRASHHGVGMRPRDLRMDRPHEPAWQTLYSRRRRSSPVRTRTQPSSSNGIPSFSASNSSQVGPSEGDLDPWDMQDAQERLAALAAPCPTLTPQLPSLTVSSDPRAISHVCADIDPPRAPKREIYAYHLVTATLEPFIKPLLSSLRSLRLITLTFYPGHLLDDDKLEHMLRRILSRSESPRLQTLLIRIAFDAASVGSRMRRFERTKTIAGAVDRIGDERVRVMLVNNKVGEGELVPAECGEQAQSPLARKAILVTKEGFWSRVLLGNHQQVSIDSAEWEMETGEQVGQKTAEKRERQLSDWAMFFPNKEHPSPGHLVGLVMHCDPWPDCPVPVA